MDELARKLSKIFDAHMIRTICGPVRKQPQTALRLTGGGRIETVRLDDAGNIIEPCPYCGPVLLCSKHMNLVT